MGGLKVQGKKGVAKTEESTKEGALFSPHVDIYETEEQVVVIADMPGVKIEDIDVSLEDDVLTIRGQRQKEERPGKLLLKEYENGSYLRRFTVSETIDRKKISASLVEGVLRVGLPKASPEKPRQIEVTLG